jgi:cytoskeletal protein RodZ
VTGEVHKLGEVLRAAREAKGVDLVRVERETKIRERYLSALESGDYRDLPGAVYTRGFLRNYGAYLGLDPEYLIDLYRLETSTSAERPTLPSPPKPLAIRRSRAFVITPGAIAAAVLTIAVGGFVAWIGYEFVNFARTPELRITDPAGNVSAHQTLTITLRGTTSPNARIAVSNLRENPTVTADDEGAFAVTVELVHGSNVVRLTATDPTTGRTSPMEERTIIVAGDEPSAPAATVALDTPAADATLTGPVAVAGTAPPGTTVTVSAALEAPAEVTFEIRSASGAPVELEIEPPSPPEPLSLTADGTGAFGADLSLAPGTWEVSLSAEGYEPISRRVVVGVEDGLRARLEIDGGESYLLLEEDGELVEDVSGLNAADGDVVELSAEDALRVRVGNAGVVRVTINGIVIGLMGDEAQVVEWRVTRAANTGN